jgi:hypothetical protein
MQQLVAIGEIDVKQDRGRQTKQTQRCRPHSRVPTDRNGDAGNEL